MPATAGVASVMAVTVLLEEQIEIPTDLHWLAEFRAWAVSDAFPQHGRIDFLAGRIEVDMSPEDLFSHGTLKVELVRVLSQRVKDGSLGYLFTDSTRLSSPEADLSAEPDLVFVSDASIESGRVRLIEKTTGEPDRYVELEGAADLVVEIVSDASVRKDTERLPAAYYQAGVAEFWLIDARGDDLLFRIHHHGESQFEPASVDEDGYQRSAVLNTSLQLDRTRNPRGRVVFDLRVRER